LNGGQLSDVAAPCRLIIKWLIISVKNESLNGFKQLYYGKIKTIGLLTSGGDAPGMNAAIRAVTRSAIFMD
jgi:hypothetical protein